MNMIGLALLTLLLSMSDTGLNGFYCLLYTIFFPKFYAHFLSSLLHFLIHSYQVEQIC